jgi:hypothetical protein
MYKRNQTEKKLQVLTAKLDVIKVHRKSYDRTTCSSENGYDIDCAGIKTCSRSKITKHLNKEIAADIGCIHEYE